MANRNLKQVATLSRNIVALPVWAESGCDADGNFTVGSDGYADYGQEEHDAYGAGYSIFRTSVGTYHLILDDEFSRIVHAGFSVSPTTTKAAFVQVKYPMNQSDSDDETAKQTRLILEVINGSGTLTDLAHGDVIHGVVWLNNAVHGIYV